MTAAFRYRAATASGEVVEGVVQADSARAASDELRRQTLVPVAVELVRAGSALGGPRWRRGVRRDAALAAATRTIAIILSGGSTLDRALAFAGAHATHAEVGSALAAVRDEVQQGGTLSSAMRTRSSVFGALAPAVVRAGEESGTLDDALSRLADHFDRARDLRDKVQAALLYPALMGVVAGVGIVVLLTFVVPRFVSILAEAGGTLPLSTRTLVGMSAVVTHGWWLLLTLGGAAWLFGRRQLLDPGNRRQWHRMRLGWPVWGPLEWDVSTARFARALGTLLESGAGVLTSVHIAREAVANEALRARLEGSATAIQRGERVSEALGTALPPLATQLLAVGEESGTLAAMALRVADTYDVQVERSLRSMVALVEPLLIVAFGGVVGFVALAMLQAIYSINAGAL
ncbi:MAG: type II secretion system F family protein [Gemmatimonadaceae bacterium]